MRILLVTHRYPPLGVAGVERLSEQTAVALKANGHDVTVLTRYEGPVPPSAKLERTSRRGVEVLMISGGGTSYGRFPSGGPMLERLFERTLLEVNPDVVLISHLINHSPLYLATARRWGVPVVLELHDFYVACERAHLERPSGELCRGPEAGLACATHCFGHEPLARERWALRTHVFRHAVEQAAALTCPSEFVADYFREMFGRRLPPLYVIGNGVEVSETSGRRTATADGPLHLACVGMVASHKGVHVILEALRLAKLGSVRLTLFGAVVQPYFGSLLQTAASIEDLEFRAYGKFEPRDLPTLLGDVDAVVVPSVVWETYSVVAHEVLACGIPVIASRIGALPEAVRPGENGLLFEAGTAIDLATLLQIVDSDRDSLARLRAGIRPSDWISVADRTRRLETVLEEAIAGDDSGAHPAGGELAELSTLRDILLEKSARF
jgi:glycosyltransferase involved in cell wall biosynthesis